MSRLCGMLLGAMLLASCTSRIGMQPTPTPVASAVRGAALFLNKGCTTCHIHSAVAGRTLDPTFAPNLSGYHRDAAFLRRWLRDPQAVKPNTRMINLQLAPDEIEDLIAFLNEPR